MRKPLDNLTLQEVKSLLDYNVETGIFHWKWRSDVRKEWNTRYAGKITGTPAHGKHDYLIITIHGQHYQAHRLAWLIITGVWPDKEIDHRDLDKTNNRFKNLREAMPFQNQGNKPLQRNNTSGFKGVSWHSRFNRFRAYITINGKIKHLGYYDSAEEAGAIYNSEAKKHFGEFMRAA